MFLFNKNTALPRSRQSSIDSLPTDPSNSDAWASQCSDASSQRGLSPDPRERPFPGKRTSVFHLRARSNTAASTNSFVTHSSGMSGSDGSSHRLSQDMRHMTNSPSSFLEMSTSKRSIFARGRKSKRQSSQFSPGSGAVEPDGIDRKRSSILRRDRNRKEDQHSATGSLQDLKHRISSPFDFQHLTHTNPKQFGAIERTSENELAAEFWAARASHVPRRELNGIKAEDLRFHNISSDDLTSPGSRSASALDTRSPPLSPDHAGGYRPSSSQDHRPKLLRLSRSVENFSQPSIHRSHRHTQSAVAPPRSSSRLALARIDDLAEEHLEDSDIPTLPNSANRQSGMWDCFVPMSPPTTGQKLPPIADEADFVGHAVTTPDDTAIHAFPFSPPLENVPEEPERFFNPRPAPQPPLRSPKSSRPPSFDTFSFRNAAKSPISRSNGRTSPLGSPKNASTRPPMTRPISQMSDTLGTPSWSRRNSLGRPSPPAKQPEAWNAMDNSWEDEVDYIYDHALEADCDRDWNCPSDEDREDRELTPGREDRRSGAASGKAHIVSAAPDEDPALRTRFFPGVFRPSLLVPSSSVVPDLEARSAVSASTADTGGVPTPSDYFPQQTTIVTAPPSFADAEGFSLTPSLLVPHDFKDQSMRDAMYEELLAEYENSDRHFPLLDASQSISSSSRSSHVRSSKRSSYDSSSTSNQGSGLWSSPARRSASSSGSLPELVHSRRARKNFDMMVDHLSAQVASFSSFGAEEAENDDDEEKTPPGRPLNAERTFFASDEEDHEQEQTEVPAPAPESRPAPARTFHKHATSDGAAKLLASATTAENAHRQSENPARKRAASSSIASRGHRPTPLSLFPAPPRYMQSPPSAR